ncbi:MAG: hypothetical protein ACLFP2_05655 [Candidatus Woesearchaeota archaeon]
MRTISNVCVIGDLICMGCCGRDYCNRKEVIESIRENTREFKHHDLISFRDRADCIRSSGVCRNVIFANEEETQVMCPLHPEVCGEDLREGHCDVKYLCKTAYLFKEWDRKKQDAFIEFIKKKNLDWFSFSMGMDDDSLLEEFESTE